MTAAFQALMFLVMASAIAGGAWFARGWYDGTLISRAESDVIAQARADEAAKWAVKIASAGSAKDAALTQLRLVRVPVSRDCPPGAGAVSGEAFQRFREGTK